MGRSIMLHFLVLFAMVGALAVAAWLQHEYGHDFRDSAPAPVTVAPTPTPLQSRTLSPDPVDLAVLRHLQRRELWCVNGYVSLLSMVNGVAKAQIINTTQGPVRCATYSGRVRTSLAP